MQVIAGYRSASARPRQDRSARAAQAAASAARAVPAGTLTVAAVEPVAETGANRFARLYRPDAALIAQLVALSENMPQQRARRRAEPAVAIEAYRAAERAPRLLEPGRVLAVSR